VESPADLTSELFYRRFMKPALYALKEQQAAAQAAQGGEA
jgi:hypothetical protein